MKSAFYASTHPAWTIHGYQCCCNQCFHTQDELFIHVLFFENADTAYKVLSVQQYERYQRCKSMDNGYKLAYKGYRISKFGDLGYYEAKKGTQGLFGDSIKELIETISKIK